MSSQRKGWLSLSLKGESEFYWLGNGRSEEVTPSKLKKKDGLLGMRLGHGEADRWLGGWAGSVRMGSSDFSCARLEPT